MSLSHGQDRERGAIAVITVIVILALIGLGAVAVDVGQIYGERAQLQNGADSAALGIAQQCYKSPALCTGAQASSWAQPLVNGNANDNATSVKSVDLSVPNQVTVTTTTLNGTTGAGFLTPLLRSALNVGPVTVAAKATAKWGIPSSGTGFPLALSSACFDLTAGAQAGQMQDFSYKPGGNGSASTQMSCTNASGQSTAGGWGWLQESSPCSVSTTSGGTVGSDTGNNPASACQSTLQNWIAALQGGGKVEVQFPVFSETAYTGNNAQYTILGYATLSIIGWQFSGAGSSPYTYNAKPPTGYPTLACGGADRCVIGQFVRFDSFASGTGGSGQDFGTASFSLIK